MKSSLKDTFLRAEADRHNAEKSVEGLRVLFAGVATDCGLTVGQLADVVRGAEPTTPGCWFALAVDHWYNVTNGGEALL